MDKQLTTFSDLRGYEQAVSLLESERIPFETISPPSGSERVAVPAIVVDRPGRNRWAEASGGTIVCSGWGDYRPTDPGRESLAQAPPGPDSTPFGAASITVLQPCVADDTKIRFVAELSGDLGEVMPYLNAVMPQVSYSPRAQTVTYMEQHRMIVLYPRRITVAKADDIVDAWFCLERIRRQVNQTWEQRGRIEPCFETRKKPPALEILKRLPGTNCGLCGELTCMAFALRLWAGEVPVGACSPIFAAEHRELREALAEICAGLGISMEAGARPAEDRAD